MGKPNIRTVELRVDQWDAGSDTLTAKFEHQRRQFFQVGVGRNEVAYKHQLSSGVWLCFLWGEDESWRLSRGGALVRIYVLTPQDREELGLNRPGADFVKVLVQLEHRSA